MSVDLVALWVRIDCDSWKGTILLWFHLVKLTCIAIDAVISVHTLHVATFQTTLIDLQLNLYCFKHILCQKKMDWAWQKYAISPLQHTVMHTNVNTNYIICEKCI